MHRTGYMAVSDKDGISGIIITGFHRTVVNLHDSMHASIGHGCHTWVGVFVHHMVHTQALVIEYTQALVRVACWPRGVFELAHTRTVSPSSVRCRLRPKWHCRSCFPPYA